jgi:putative transposase
MSAIVKGTPTGKWFVSIRVEMADEEVQAALMPASCEQVGIDVGLSTFAYVSTGEAMANARFFRTEEAARPRAQRKRAKTPKGSKQQAKKRKVVARVHARIGHRRKNCIEQEVCKLIKQFGLLAEEAGRQVVRVNPAYTSQTCSACRHRQPMPLSVRLYECPHCGLLIHRDHNASLNILEEGLKAVGRHSRVIPEAPGL